MILHAQAKEGQTGFPWLVFLHGFPAIVGNGRRSAKRFRIIRGYTSICRDTVALLTSA
jgi:hypothetical protein